MRMQQGLWLSGMILAGTVAVGCASDDDGYRYNDPSLERNRTVQRTSQEAEDARLDTAGQQPYSTIKGDTTGDGMRIDRRTGGSITGSDVTAGERADGNARTPARDFEGDRSAIPTRPGTGSLNTGPDVGVAPGSGGGRATQGVGPDAPASGVAPGQ